MGNPLRVVTMPRRANPWKIAADRWIILYWDPFVRLHFLFWDTLNHRPYYFIKREYAMDAYRLHFVQGLDRMRIYEPRVLRYEALKEFEDYQQRVHDNLLKPVVFFGEEKAIEQISKGTRLATISARDPFEDQLIQYASDRPQRA